MTEEDIVKAMAIIARALDFDLNDNVLKIAKLKSRMGKDWHRCPCDRDNPERYCGSRLCEEETKKNGVCHCGCFKRRENA